MTSIRIVLRHLYRPLVGLMVSFLLVAGLAGCGGPPFPYRKAGQQTFADDAYARPLRYTKRAAVAVSVFPQAPIWQALGGVYEQELMHVLGKKTRRLSLIDSRHAQYPAFMADLDQQDATPAGNLALALQARSAGFQLVVHGVLDSVRVFERPWGMLWFKDVRYFVELQTHLDVVDTITGAKLFSRLSAVTVRIDANDYDAVKSGIMALVSDDLEEAVADDAKKLAKKAADILNDHPWQTIVAGVQDGHVLLDVGSAAGLKVKDRLLVFQGRRTIDNKDGQTFIVPGYRAGLIRVEKLTDATTAAVVVGKGQVQAGDIAVAAK